MMQQFEMRVMAYNRSCDMLEILLVILQYLFFERFFFVNLRFFISFHVIGHLIHGDVITIYIR